jgi:hypothetical protein
VADNEREFSRVKGLRLQNWLRSTEFSDSRTLSISVKNPAYVPSVPVPLAPEFPVHDLHCLSRVLAARFLRPGEVEDRAHALTGRANATSLA